MNKIKYILIAALMAAFLFTSTAHADSYIATAYDLSVECCGKSKSHPSYGVTASGFNLKGHTWHSARTVSADLSVHRLGTQLYIKFPEPYSHMDGIYTVRDTGGGVVGYHLDIFFGEDAYEAAIKFGRQRIEVSKI